MKRSLILWSVSVLLTFIIILIQRSTTQNPLTATIPSTVRFLSFFTLYAGLLLSFRIGLEYFNENQKIKKLTLPAVIFFFFYTIAVTPLRRTYELNAINKKVLPITDLFDLQSIILFVLWITAMIVIFNSRNPRYPALVFSIITALVFFLV